MSGKGGSMGAGGKFKGGSGKGNKGQTETIIRSVPRKTTSIDDTIVMLRKAVFNDDGTDKNVTEGLSPFMKYDRNGLDLEINFTPKLNKKEKEWAFELVKENMEERYDASGYGWDDDDKMRELTENGARFLVVREWPEDDSASQGELAAFAHFRFTVQGEFMDEMCGESCLIVWDLHVEEEYQRKGLGKHLLTILELVAKREGMSRVYIPVQLEDDITMAWVDRVCVPRGYTPDASLVSLINFDAEMEGFEVYCKEMKAPVKKADSSSVGATSTTEAAAPVSVFTGKDVSNTPAAAVVAVAKVTPVLEAEAETEAEAEEEEPLNLTDALQKLTILYEEKHGRAPGKEELEQWESVLKESDVTEQQQQEAPEDA